MHCTLKFICCDSYDFADDKGVRHNGFSCKAFDPTAKQIVKVKISHLLDKEFGDDIEVNLVPNGRYITYVYAE